MIQFDDSLDTEYFNAWLEETLPDMERTPAETVVEFIKLCNSVAKYFNYKLVDNSRFDKLMKAVFAKYCTSKNRQYEYSGRGTYYTGTEIASCIFLSEKKAEVETAKVKKLSPVRRYSLLKQGKIWKIESVEYLAGNNKWEWDSL